MKSPTLETMIRVPFKGRDELMSIAEAEQLHINLGRLLCAEIHHTNSEKINHAVCAEFGLRLEELTSDAKPDCIVFPRHVAMWLHRMLTSMSLHQIGAAFPKDNGKPRDHGTVLHACRSVEARMADKAIWERVMRLHKQLLLEAKATE